jgi:hypothetical protein
MDALRFVPMQYAKPGPEQLEALAAFLRRPAREAIRSEAGDLSVFDEFVDVYDEYPRYGRLRDIHDQELILGDRFFRVFEVAMWFLAATQLDYDPFGILGPPHSSGPVAMWHLEMKRAEFDDYLQGIAGLVHATDNTLVIEMDWMDMFQRGPSIEPEWERPPVYHEGDIVIVREIGGAKVSLVRKDGGLALDIDGETSAISQTEANVLLRAGEDHLLDWVCGPQVNREDRLVDMVTRGLRQDLDGVFMDQSTFRTALFSLEHDVLRPTGLFDLSCLAHHVVFADTVVVPQSVDVPAQLADVFVKSDAHEITMSIAFARLASPNSFDPKDALEVDGLSQIELAWSAFLGTPISLEYGYVDLATNSPGSWEYLPGGEDDPSDAASLLKIGVPSSRGDTQALASAASIHTFRYLFNERRAQLMGLPYAASALRYPVQAVRLRNGLHFRSVIDQLLHPATSMDLKDHLARAAIEHLRLPDALAVACSRSRDRSEILPRLLELREEMTSVREELQEGRSLGRPTNEILSRLRKAAPGIGYAATVDAAVVRLNAVATATGTDLGTALIASKVAGPLRLAERATRFVDAVRRPHVRVLQRFDQALANAATTEQMFQLWDMSPTREWFDVAVRLSDLTPFESAKLHTF